jgi:hypothetical protein
MSEKTLARIAALLRKAEGTDNEHESDAYLQAAQRLATLASVDLAVARAHTAEREKRATPTMREVVIGESGRRGLRTFAMLFLAIAHANNLTCDIARDSSKIFAYGFDADIDAVERLYSSLVVQMVRASDAFIKSGSHAAERVWREVTVPDQRRPWVMRRSFEERPVHATTARINFQQAFAARIGRRLAETRQQAEQAAVAGDRTTGTEIALRARELELKEHYRSHSAARGTWAGGRAQAGRAELSRRAGDRAGRTARLSAPESIDGSGPALTAGA